MPRFCFHPCRSAHALALAPRIGLDLGAAVESDGRSAVRFGNRISPAKTLRLQASALITRERCAYAPYDTFL
ncbi:hypothetical protein MA20_38355 [Bradyrhizobium japonicum]|uniref:Uncharacterized protein n=1 Tax=Bradyrhizobium japonicum TaxID=375 RepID=A0A0A3XMS3_BRAJP|nr:hypothetical protein MA20_38355 [Bradyrhizobium japonicum]